MLRWLDLTADGTDQFLAEHQPIPSGRAYGGELVAQALTAASRTVPDDRLVHSLHGYFLRPVDVSRPTRWIVDRVRDGRGFTSRAVRGEQGGKDVFTGLFSFHVPRPGPTHAGTMPQWLGDPEDLPSTEKALAGAVTRDAEYWSHGRGFDLRHDPSPVYTVPAADRSTRQAVWFRSTEPLPDDPALRRAALSYVCDYTLLEPVLRRHGAHWTGERVVTASVDHAMWFHADAPLDDWNVLVQDSPAAENGVGLGTASIFTRDGRLLATVAQQGVVLV